MALEQLELETGLNKVDYAIKLLRDNEPEEGYYLADSGGKDSCVVRDILIRSGCKFDAHYNVSPIDPPDIFTFLRLHHPDTKFDYRVKGFWKLVEKKGLPYRHKRWCCEYIKESGGIGRMVVAGMRSSESYRRKKYNYIETVITRDRFIGAVVWKIYVLPILAFTESDVWQYINDNNIDYCNLYDEGFKRLGCILCPFSSNKKLEEQKFPKVAKLWLRACNRLVENAKERDYKTKRGIDLRLKFETGQEMYDWWVNG